LGGILCTDYRPLPSAAATAKALQAEVLLYPLEDTFALHSNPGANQILFIDFDGNDGIIGNFPAWSLDGDASTFNDTERTRIQQVWQSVSEDWLPFTVDVTTEAPPSGWLGQRAVIDGSATNTYSFAYFGDWASTQDREAYIYYGDNTWQWIAESIAHEVGHTFNLTHDGRGSVEYYQGHGSGDTQWCPIMGWGADSLNQWDQAEYNGHVYLDGNQNPDTDITNQIELRAERRGTAYSSNKQNKNLPIQVIFRKYQNLCPNFNYESPIVLGNIVY
jgi:hypothetical protein